jgi:hypothetical protein
VQVLAKPNSLQAATSEPCSLRLSGEQADLAVLLRVGDSSALGASRTMTHVNCQR